MVISYLAYVMIVIGIFTFYMAVVHLVRPNRGLSRVQKFADAGNLDALEDVGAESTPLSIKLGEKILPALNIKPENQKEVSLELARAGIYSPYAITYYFLFKYLIQPIVLIVGIAYAYINTRHTDGLSEVAIHLIIAGVLVILGLYGAKLYIKNCKQKRQQKMAYSFPEVLDLLLVCIEAGLGLDAALNRVCRELRELHPEVIYELDRTRLELTMLNDRVTALENLSERAEIIPFRTLVAALIQTERFGTSLVDTLRVLSEEQRVTRLYSAEQKAARIPVLITIPLILFIMPAFVIVIMGPPIINVMEQGGLFGEQHDTSRVEDKR